MIKFIIIILTSFAINTQIILADTNKPLIDIINKTIEYNGIIYTYELNKNVLLITPNKSDACIYFEKIESHESITGIMDKCANYDYKTQEKLISTIKTNDLNVVNQLENYLYKNQTNHEKEIKKINSTKYLQLVLLIIFFTIYGLTAIKFPKFFWNITKGGGIKTYNHQSTHYSIIKFLVA